MISPVIEALIVENIESGRRGKTHYSITDVMKLISAIPQVSDSELAMVIRTISSFGVDIKGVIKEAIEKERLANRRIEQLKQEVQNYRSKIQETQEEIGLLDVGVTELKKSKDCLIKGVRLLKESGTPLIPTENGLSERADMETVAEEAKQSDDNKDVKKNEAPKSNSTSKKKTRVKAKTAKTKAAKTKGKTKTESAQKDKPAINTTKTMELTSINLDVKPIKRK